MAAFGDRWIAEVGGISHGRVAKDLQQPYRVHGAAKLFEALAAFVRHRSDQFRAGDAKPDGWPQFVANIAALIPKAVA